MGSQHIIYMKRFILFLLCAVGWSAQAQSTVNLSFRTIAEMVAHPVTVHQTNLNATVFDPIRGGSFYYSPAVSPTNGGTVFAANGTGRWLRRPTETFLVSWFGPTADGATDDSVVLQGAMTAAAGKILEFTPGATYLVSTQLVIPDYTTLDGKGALLKTTGTNRIFYTDYVALDYLESSTVKNFVLTGTNSDELFGMYLPRFCKVQDVIMTNGAAIGIFLERGDHNLLERIQAYNFRTNITAAGGIRLQSTDCLVSDCTVSNTLSFGIGLSQGSDRTIVQNNSIMFCGGSNAVYTNYAWGITTTFSDDVIIRNNTIKFARQGVNHHGGNNVSIIGNMIQYCMDGIGLAGDSPVPGPTLYPSNILVSANSIFDCGVSDNAKQYGVGIQAYYIKNSKITGNKLVRNSWQGIQLNNASFCQVSDNQVFDTGFGCGVAPETAYDIIASTASHTNVISMNQVGGMADKRAKVNLRDVAGNIDNIWTFNDVTAGTPSVTYGCQLLQGSPTVHSLYMRSKDAATTAPYNGLTLLAGVTPSLNIWNAGISNKVALSRNQLWAGTNVISLDSTTERFAVAAQTDVTNGGWTLGESTNGMTFVQNASDVTFYYDGTKTNGSGTLTGTLNPNPLKAGRWFTMVLTFSTLQLTNTTVTVKVGGNTVGVLANAAATFTSTFRCATPTTADVTLVSAGTAAGNCASLVVFTTATLKLWATGDGMDEVTIPAAHIGATADNSYGLYMASGTCAVSVTNGWYAFGGTATVPFRMATNVFAVGDWDVRIKVYRGTLTSQMKMSGVWRDSTGEHAFVPAECSAITGGNWDTLPYYFMMVPLAKTDADITMYGGRTFEIKN